MGPGYVDAAALQRDGHLVARGAVGGGCLARAQVACQVEIERTLAGLTPEDKPKSHAAYLSATMLWEHNRDIRSVVCSARLGRIAAVALGAERVRLLYDQLFVKPPGAPMTMWHQDQGYWPIDTNELHEAGGVGAVRIWVSMTDVPAEVGGLHFVDGSHLAGPIDNHDLSGGPPGERSTFSVRGCDHPVVDYGGFAAGDATVHAGYTLHAARRNPSNRTRFGLSMVYVIDGARVFEPSDENHQTLIDWFIPGRAPGDRIDTARNPVVWPPEGL